MSKKIVVSSAMILIVVVVGFVWWRSMGAPAPKYTGPVEKMTLGMELSPLSALLWVAENKGYFQENGVEVTMKKFDSGRSAFVDMLSGGGLDMVTVSQTPVMFNSFDRSDFAITANMAFSYKDLFVLARRDHGIAKSEDLRGKKIGVHKGSTGEYFLSVFLTANNLKLSEVEEVDIATGKLTSSVTEGTVDAISTWNPHIFNAQEALGNRGITFPSEELYREDWYFVSNQQFLKNHPEAIARFLQAIKQAEGFIENNKDETIAITSERLGVKKDFISSIWNDYQFELFLDQIIIIGLENEARWAIRNKLTDKTKVPNYLNYIYFDALEKVKPETVTIVH